MKLRDLNERDLAVVQELIERCADYYLLAEGRPPRPDAAQELWAARPADTPSRAKHLLGLCDPELVGVLDVIEDWPRRGTWLIGLLLIDPNLRRRGLGRRAVGLVSSWAAQAGAERLRVAVLPANAEALEFWTRLRFTPVRSASPSAVALEREVT